MNIGPNVEEDASYGMNPFLCADSAGHSGKSSSFSRFDRLVKNRLRGRSPRHELLIASRKDFRVDGSSTNKTIAKATNGQG